MASELETPSFGNFGIENTMEMGMGNAELLNDLLSPETASSDPNEIQEIVKEVKQPIPEKSTKQRGKEIIPEELDEEGKKKEPSGQDIVSSFLGTNEGDEEEEEQVEQVEEEERTNEDSPFTSLSNDLFKLGVFTKDEDEGDVVISSPEEFLERFNSEKKKGAIEVFNNFIDQFGEDYRKAFDAIYVNGVDPAEYWGTYNTIVNFTELDLTQEENQIKVMRQALADQGFDPEDITTEIDRLKNYGDLENVSAKHHRVLVKKEAVKLQQLEQKAQQELQQKAAIKKQYIENVQNILQEKVKAKEYDGIPINPKLANELQDFLLVDKWKTPSGETLTDFDRAILELKKPENHNQKVKVALLLKILEKDPTLSTIQRSGISKKSDQLFEEVARQVTKSKQVTPAKPKSWFS